MAAFGAGYLLVWASTGVVAYVLTWLFGELAEERAGSAHGVAVAAFVVCGAYHSPALTHDLPPMDDKEYKALPKADVSLTLMPYSYYRLSSQSGYGAGNHAPAYYQHLFDAMRAGDKHGLNPHYQAKVCHALRKKGITFQLDKLPSGLYKLFISNQPLRDLSILRGLPLHELDLHRCPFSDLTPLRDLKLHKLSLSTDSVTDGKGRCHDLPNLIVADGSLLPTVGAANPGSTIGAVALMMADHLAGDMQ